MPRLDRFLSNATELSRSQARRAIRAAEVAVNDRIVRDPGRPVSAADRVRWRDRPVVELPLRYFMLHKPAGFECSSGERVHRSIFELLDEPQPQRLHAAGRLDLDATGLVLVTDDGEWSHAISAPRRKQPKAYRVGLAQPCSADDPLLERLRAGVQLRGEPRPTAPAEVEWLGARELRLILHEGRYHQVKRMLAAVGNRVAALHRERIGALWLDPELRPGGYRALTEAERRLALSDTSPY